MTTRLHGPALEGRVGTAEGKAERELRRRLNSPQRHRLLQGYPMRRLMVPARSRRFIESEELDLGRDLIMGVLPHTFCNPRVSGCGFCTFPHEQYQAEAVRKLVEAVSVEIQMRAERIPGLRGRKVAALYFGGGTANLTPPDSFENLCGTLSSTFDLRSAEVTFEGVPIYFLARKGRLLDVFADVLDVRHKRLSMGLQTFDKNWLELMGRQAFGSSEQIAELVDMAHAKGMTVSGDFLINLPREPRSAMLEDIDRAAAMGFDQICVYHLVLFPGLGTPWSRDPLMTDNVPDNETAFGNWLAVRERLFELGYTQTTLTNFEKTELVNDSRAFLYEKLSFSPERTDGIGFGPSAISTFTSKDSRSALKTINAATASDYQSAIRDHRAAYSEEFGYELEDVKLLHVTRKLPTLGLDRGVYFEVFGSDVVADFSASFLALREAGLVTIDERRVNLTARGMFYADSVAGLLAWPRVQQLRRRLGINEPRKLPLNKSSFDFMG